jgi:hypothetical protein
MNFLNRSGPKYFIFGLVAFFAFEFMNNWSLSSDVYWSVMGLDGRSTAYDYMSSTTETRLRFTNNLCDNGVCLDEVDWRCGFTIDSLEFESENHNDWNDAVESCFTQLARVAPVYTKLDKIRKICGRHYMQFDPLSGETIQKCTKVNGKWGVKIRLFSDEEELISKAKIKK